MNLFFERIADQLLSNSIAYEDDILPVDVLDALVNQALLEYQQGEFKEANIGKGIAKQRIAEVRGDKVLWLNKSQASPHLSQYWSYVDELRLFLSEYFRIHLERTEMHFAVYPKGAFYTQHLDQFRDHGNRVFSIVLYLNQKWRVGDGGELRIHNADNTFYDIQPIHGRLVVFRSDQILHEVLRTEKPRISLTGWMHRDPFII